jgi:hypothetical protein
MRHDRLVILGSIVVGAMIVTGCGSSSSSIDGAAGKTGSGGSGAGGKATDAGADKGPTTDTGTDTSGAGGSSDAHADLGNDTATDTGSGDTATDVAVDAPADTGARDAGPCVTGYGANNSVLYAFNGGVNGGWYTYTRDDSNTMLTTSLGASFTEGRKCPGSVLLATNFTAYGTHESGFLETFFNTPLNWTAYKALHAWIKAESPDLGALNGVYFYVKSGAQQADYQSDFAAGVNLSDWHELVIDLTHPANGGAGVVPNDIHLIGFEVYLNTAPTAGEPATPSQVLLLADDIWLEAAPPSDAGSGDSGDGGGQ